eukprot:scaffold28521_cov94-Cyclotella_meneghiniana.AAC.1
MCPHQNFHGGHMVGMRPDAHYVETHQRRERDIAHALQKERVVGSCGCGVRESIHQMPETS